MAKPVETVRALLGAIEESAPRAVLPYLFPAVAIAGSVLAMTLVQQSLPTILVYCAAGLAVMRYEASRLIADEVFAIPKWYRRSVVAVSGAGIVGAVLGGLLRLPAWLSGARALLFDLTILSFLPTVLPPMLLGGSWMLRRWTKRVQRLEGLGEPKRMYVALLVAATIGVSSRVLVLLDLNLGLGIGAIITLLVVPLLPYALSQPLWSPSFGPVRSVGLTLPFWQTVKVLLLGDLFSFAASPATSMAAWLWVGAAVVWAATVGAASIASLATSLVSRVGARKASRLSIQPDPASYVDVTLNREWLENFIRDFDAGVVGITGVRGAGKSALISAVTSTFSKDYFVLNLTSPVRHEGGIAFLSTVCRAVCEKVLNDTALQLRRARTAEQRARSEAWRRLGFAVLVVLGIGAGLYWGVSSLASRRPEISHEDLIELIQFGDSLAIGRTIKEIADARAMPLHGYDGFNLTLSPSYSAFNPPFLLLPARVGDAPPARATTTEVAAGDATLLRGWGYSLWQERVLIPAAEALGDRVIEIDTASQYPDLRDVRQKAADQLVEPAGAYVAQVARLIGTAAPGWQPMLATEVIIRALAEHYPGSITLGLAQADSLKEALIAYEHTFSGLTPRIGLLSGQPGSRATGGGSRRSLFAVAMLGLLVAAVLFWDRVRSWTEATLRSGPNQRLLTAMKEAEDFLQLISYSSSTEQSAGFGWQGVTAARTRGLAERELTLSGLTQRYARFVGTVADHYNGKMIIAIDELDKIHDPEMVKSLLFEIKGVLFLKQCFYLLSISEDAAQSFRNRLSAGRDIFESTFDDIIELARMNGQDAIRMASARVEAQGASDAFGPAIQMVNVLSAGVPRELIRNLRTISAELGAAPQWPPTAVAHRIIRRDLLIWLEDIPEMPLSGGAALKVRTAAREAFDSIGERYSPGGSSVAWKALSECRRRVLAAQDLQRAAPADGTVPADPCGPYLRECLRLLLAITALEASEHLHPAQATEAALLEVGRAIDPNPDYAFELLSGLRLELGLPDGAE